MKTFKILYWVSTGLLTLMMLGSSGMYIFNHEEVSTAFSSLGFPVWIIYPLAAAKILGLVAIWTKRSKMLLEWAYAGFFFDTMLAAGAHIMVGDGQFPGAVIGLVLTLVSYFSYHRLHTTNPS